jgi:molybdate transport system ATP-binding protein
MGEGLVLDLELDRGGFALRVQQEIAGTGITAISGPSGSGKTTLLRIVAGLEGAQSGDVRFRGQSWQARGQGKRGFVPPHRRRIGMVFQEPRLFPHLDVRHNLAYGASRAGVEAAAIEVFVAALDIGPLLDRPVRGLSGGEQRRVALARTLAMRPQLLCLDEPLTGLDRRRRDELLPYLARAVGQAGCPALYVSHDPSEIAALADRVLPLEAGLVAAPGMHAVPDCLDLTVLSADGAAVTLDLAGHPVRVGGAAERGSVRRVHVPRDAVLVSLDPPGRTGAAFAVPAEARGVCPNGGGYRFACGAHEIRAATLPHGLSAADLAGRPVWLMGLRVALMPDRGPAGPEMSGQRDRQRQMSRGLRLE